MVIKEVEEIKQAFIELKQDVERLEYENVKLKNQILSLELDTCIPELRKENKELLVNKNVAQGIATKYKQALDIFERTHIHIYYLRRTKNVEEYNKMIDKINEYDFFDYLIQEDYNLLKEVLGNAKD